VSVDCTRQKIDLAVAVEITGSYAEESVTRALIREGLLDEGSVTIAQIDVEGPVSTGDQIKVGIVINVHRHSTEKAKRARECLPLGEGAVSVPGEKYISLRTGYCPDNKILLPVFVEVSCDD